MPERIQLQRKRGWRLPEGAIVVARPSKWGNPSTVAGAIEHGFAATEEDARKLAVERYRDWILGLERDDNDIYRAGQHQYDRRWVREHLPDLTGKTLACWCPPGAPCHADVLLAIVNGEDEAGRALMGVLHPHRLPVWW